jgi:hypothetical protein
MNRSRRRIARFASAFAVAAVAAAVVIPSSAASAQTLFSRANCSIDGVPLADEDESEDSPGNYVVVFAVDWPTTGTVDDVVTTPRVFMQNLIPLNMFDLDGAGTPDTTGVDIGHTLGEFTVIDPSGDESPATIDAVRASPDFAPTAITYAAGHLPSQTLSEAGTYTLNWNRLSGTMTNTVDGITESHDWECVPATTPWPLARIEVSGTRSTTVPAEPAGPEGPVSTNPNPGSSTSALPGGAASTPPQLAETGLTEGPTSGLVGVLAVAVGAGVFAFTRAKRTETRRP